jgi:trimeric autotransporter adhesin
VGGNGIGVFVDSNGQLGTMVSSGRFKEQVKDMGDSTNALMKLRPVTYFYKPEYDKGPRTLQYGLIAEEVAQVYPELVAYDNDGKPYTVRYQYLTSMLLNEAQKQYRRAESQAEVIATQQQKIDQLEQRLTRLESVLDAQTKVAQAGASHVTASGYGEVQ